MPYRRSVQGGGGAVLSNGTSISGDPGAPMVPARPTIREATGGGGPHALGGHHDVDPGGARHGLQRERYRGGQPVSGSWVLPETADCLARVRLSVNASHLPDRLHVLEETLHSDVGLYVASARPGAGAVARRGGQWGTTVVAVGAHLSPAGGNGQACGGHLYGGVSHQQGRQDHAVSQWASACPDRDRTAERIGVAGAGSRDGRAARTGDGRNVFSGRGASLPSLGPGPLRDSGCVGVGARLQLSTPTTHDVPGSLEGCIRCRVPNHAILLSLRQRRSVWGGPGRGQTEALLSSGSAYRLRPGAGWRRTGTDRDRGRDPAVCIFCLAGISNRCACTGAVRPLSGHGHYLVDRWSGIGECGGGDRAFADERAHLTVRELWRLVAGGQSDRRRDPPQYFPRSPCR